MCCNSVMVAKSLGLERIETCLSLPLLCLQFYRQDKEGRLAEVSSITFLLCSLVSITTSFSIGSKPVFATVLDIDIFVKVKRGFLESCGPEFRLTNS